MATQKEHRQRWQENHFKALEALRAPSCRKSGRSLWLALRRQENRAHWAAEQYCNDSNFGSDRFDVVKAEVAQNVERIFGATPEGFFVNTDPRGYALKLKDSAPIPEGMHKDWGGYGCLAADFK